MRPGFPPHPFLAWVAAIGGCLMGVTVHAAEPARETPDEIHALRDRLDKLEQRNSELEQARTVAGLQRISIGVSLLGVGQTVNNDATLDGVGESQLNYRADVSVSLPVGSIGGGEGELFAQVRAGQGDGLSNLRPLYSAVNATAFQLTGTQPDNSAALLAQVWYQANLAFAGTGDTRRRLEVTVGKLDAFVFFDQNTAADDEASKFLNGAFVHNPLLDLGGDVGADAYGFQPGLRLAYVSESGETAAHSLSLGVFGAGRGAHFDNTFSSPFAIAQAETRRIFGGREGNYRLYVWRNGQAAPFNDSVAVATEQHAGWGISIDQQVSGNTTLFGRYGQETKGRVQFDRAVTVGAEIAGSAWNRVRDAVGIAVGLLRTSDEFRAAAPTLDADSDGTPDFGYTPDASESVYELYYHFGVSENVEITPDVQRIRQPAGNRAAPGITVVGLRAQVSF